MEATLLTSGPQFLEASRGFFPNPLSPLDYDFILSITSIAAGSTLIVTIGGGGVDVRFNPVTRAPIVQVIAARADPTKGAMYVSWQTRHIDGARLLEQPSPLTPGPIGGSPALSGPYHVFGVTLRSKKG
jgi:hypothetical protein